MATATKKKAGKKSTKKGAPKSGAAQSENFCLCWDCVTIGGKSFPIPETLRDSLKAGMGAVDSRRELAHAFVQGLLDKGHIDKDQAAKLLQSWMNTGREQARNLGEKAIIGAAKAGGELVALREEIDKKVQGLLGTFQFPSRKEIEKLYKKIEALDAKVEALSGKK